MNKSAVVHVRIESETKTAAEGVLRKLGLSTAEAIRLFYHQICLRNGLPFPVHIPNELTRKILAKSHQGEDVESFCSLEKMFESWER
ncbi:MAG: type II toxin-antitoxin system antitoxin, RelB/DinJ family [bacterium (Candidatus Ratteibacteria) CG23_combo_of_CG06-09_8_20_14_all_48_7]|uniref:Type II toxin-antitoxin system antitoxin, RelB/DinJ family n=1 Tax=bacterium (Candidatus Ratteibacteria) CG23_combo_of_CG06-09_8_20_14_all_48_7 TaxID=2014292 RepID=A0A2G9Y9C4_9BACT|nr:MAG: type II toxin-antitoxin system antitoxin, RelB/DinJ family [bacterium (Candidatus Ratteibacteria) CG23_combo_of_CG06-09_8_20_14_all_48_7]